MSNFFQPLKNKIYRVQRIAAFVRALDRVKTEGIKFSEQLGAEQDAQPFKQALNDLIDAAEHLARR